MNYRIIKTVSCVIALSLAVVVCGFYLEKERDTCMGVPIISQNKSLEFDSYTDTDLNGHILHMEKPVAIDNQSRTIYIAQNMDNETLHTEMDGLLEAIDGKKLYFVDDGGFDNFGDSVADGHKFPLIVEMTGGEYTTYSVVFTNLPVIRITGDVSYVNEENRNIYAGDIYIWEPLYENTGKYLVKESFLEWNRRGGSTLGDDKKSWKLSFKNEDGSNREMEFLGLEDGDDDWILNAIHRDDTKVREKLVMDIWNNHCETADYNYKMSTGRYAEVICNGEYCGLYLLQRRVDGKYLELEDEILLKSIKATDGLPIEYFYDIVYPKVEISEKNDPATNKLTEDEKYILGLMEPFFEEEYGDMINIDNWMDVSLMIDFGYMPDNAGRKNIYYVLDVSDGQTEVKQVLWDTDFSFGVSYKSGFVHRPENAVSDRRYRREDEYLMEKYPDFDKMMAERWFQLREGMLCEENVYSTIEKCYSEITLCGAFDREKEKWGWYYEGETDTIETLYKYIEQRYEFLDREYLKALGN